MCGIIGIVRRPPTRPPADRADVLDRLDAAAGHLERATSVVGVAVADALDAAATVCTEVDRLLGGVPGVLALVRAPELAAEVSGRLAELSAGVATMEARLDSGDAELDGPTLETVNARLVSIKDAVWAVGRDRLRAAREVHELVGTEVSDAGLAVAFSLHQALSALDRLEVRGRDSAGIEVTVWNHGIDLGAADVQAALAARSHRAFTSGSLRVAGDRLVFVYKVAAEIGELGDNTAALRTAMHDDELLARALIAPGVEGLVLGHTRWASIGIVSVPNAHPQCGEETDGVERPLVTAVLNGDVDNHADLVASDGLGILPEITTDAKVIPALFARGLAEGIEPLDAFRETVVRLEGSVAIGAHAAGNSTDRLHLALRGSGQALYVGLAEDAFIVASEPYGVVEETDTYLRLDGETPSNPDNPTGSRGQIVELQAAGAGTIEGMVRRSYDGSSLPIDASELVTAQITTRDIDRGDFPHFLLKEITDAPGSFRKTLRGKLIETPEGFRVNLGDDTLPMAVRADLESGRITRVLVIGQGTAAVAGQSCAEAIDALVADTPVRAEAVLATEVSGFRLRTDMSDTLVVAISQSGTTTDTNRTVDLLRGRGARVIAIVNRRGSDLTDKADGVLYTSDGRDVEMAVASTKAFYSQVAAGLLLAYAVADHVPGARRAAEPAEQEVLAALRDLPVALEGALAARPQAAEAAARFCPSRRYWAIVGNGLNSIAAREIRIKLSELCYKSIACDATEDKKHIDLSCEPLIVVSAAGLVGSTADDVAKEVAIFRAHKAAPIVIASEGDRSFPAALAVITVPSTHPRLGFILAAMAGHLFGYEAALAIDAQARPLREARAAIETAAADLGGDLHHETIDGDALLRRLRPALTSAGTTLFEGLRAGAFNGHLEAGTAVRVAGLFRYALGLSPLDAYQTEFGKIGTPGVVLEDLTAGLTEAIEELTRPVDAIKHQAKTVTVGISRSDESLLHVPLVEALLAAGSPRDRLAYSTLRTVAGLDPAVVEVLGSTRYAIEHADDPERARILVVDRSGLAAGIPSRTERDPRLRGTKALVAREQEPFITLGRSDGRTVLIVPERKDAETTGLTLLHLRLAERLPADVARSVLSGYRRRYQSLREHVTETEEVFRDDLLADQSVIELLTTPMKELAERWSA